MGKATRIRLVQMVMEWSLKKSVKVLSGFIGKQ